MRRVSSRSPTRAAIGLAALAAAGCATLSVPEEQQLADRFEADIRRQHRLVTDTVVVGYVDQVGRRIVAAAGPQPFAYEFSVIDDPEINAFAGPAGMIYVNTGTILAARNVSELAGVIAHEVGHVAERHISENYGKQRAAGIAHTAAVLGGGLLAGSVGANAANLATGLGLTGVLNSFGREAEREADDFAVQVLPRAGYDPRGLPSFFETLVAEGGPSGPSFLSSHPAPKDRLVTTRTAIDDLALPADLRRDDGGKLEIIQRRIELLTGESGPRRRDRTR
jgi:beta-barrel assembly-enhancing protease